MLDLQYMKLQSQDQGQQNGRVPASLASTARHTAPTHSPTHHTVTLRRHPQHQGTILGLDSPVLDGPVLGLDGPVLGLDGPVIWSGDGWWP